MIEVTLYTKPDCHLCECVESVIHEVARSHQFRLISVNILNDSAAYTLYQYEIPVVFVDGREIARHRLDRQSFEQALNRAGSCYNTNR